MLELNTNQGAADDAILQQVATLHKRAHFCIQGSARTGKTFFYQCHYNYYSGQDKIILCVASWSIAALLLPGGQTAHFQCTIPLEIHELSVYKIGKNTQLADLIQRIS